MIEKKTEKKKEEKVKVVKVRKGSFVVDIDEPSLKVWQASGYELCE